MDNNLSTVFVFLAAACLVVPLASRFKLGPVLGYLAAGIIILVTSKWYSLDAD